MNENDWKMKADQLVTEYAAKFPNLPLIRTLDTMKMMKSVDENSRPILVDVRSEQERSISYLPGSISLCEFEKLDWPKIKERIVITYCTVGMRSGIYGSKLLCIGFKDVRNGEGILLWTHTLSSNNSATDEFSLIRHSTTDGTIEQTKEVHVFNNDFNLIADGYAPVIFSSFDIYWYGWKCWWYSSFNV